MVFPYLIPFSPSNSFIDIYIFEWNYFLLDLLRMISVFLIDSWLIQHLTPCELQENRPSEMGRRVGYLFNLGLELVMAPWSVESGILIMHGLHWQRGFFKMIAQSCLELKCLLRTWSWQIEWLLQYVTVEMQSVRTTGVWSGLAISDGTGKKEINFRVLPSQLKSWSRSQSASVTALNCLLTAL